ncbi:hypothetical protein KFK09_010242 [Dendrobium nobile]|uniref:Uncharacterized protein n=1 Tax=Dendrobium nobile TaxID=94219 RepID=A0A8T3BJ88_DENNO|nr:hypothetical protein KFK09_010242 [Dendrobium nobile]
MEVKDKEYGRHCNDLSSPWSNLLVVCRVCKFYLYTLCTSCMQGVYKSCGFISLEPKCEVWIPHLIISPQKDGLTCRNHCSNLFENETNINLLCLDLGRFQANCRARVSEVLENFKPHNNLNKLRKNVYMVARS